MIKVKVVGVIGCISILDYDEIGKVHVEHPAIPDYTLCMDRYEEYVLKYTNEEINCKKCLKIINYCREKEQLMTGYYIEVGYNSHYYRDEVWEELKEIVEDICKNPELIRKEIKRETDINIPDGYIEAYKWPCEDLTIQIKVENIGTDEERKYIYQCASSGNINFINRKIDNSRTYKEICRRAFCRLVLLEMHKKQMEINIYVA